MRDIIISSIITGIGGAFLGSPFGRIGIVIGTISGVLLGIIVAVKNK